MVSEDKELERETTRVARHHGCDRAVFTVCWGELEKGLECRCKADAKRNLRARSRKESPNGECEDGKQPRNLDASRDCAISERPGRAAVTPHPVAPNTQEEGT
jgi:hypothetical protein